VHQDYILRMIQQLSGFVAAVLQLRQSGRSAEAITQIEDAYGRYSGLSATLVHAISEDDLVQLLRARGGLDPDRCWALAELLREEALAYDDLGQERESSPRFLKSLRLYLEVLEEVDDLPDVLDVTGLEEVIERVSDFDLQPPTRRKLVDFFERTGRLDRAENIVLWSLDAPIANDETVADAIAFYERLHLLPDDRLEAGGFSRDEVEQGLATVVARKTAESVA